MTSPEEVFALLDNDVKTSTNSRSPFGPPSLGPPEKGASLGGSEGTGVVRADSGGVKPETDGRSPGDG